MTDEQHSNSHNKTDREAVTNRRETTTGSDHGNSEVKIDQSINDPRADGNQIHSTVYDKLLTELGSKPGLWVPFFVVGCLLTLVDYLRERDPLPTEPFVSESTFEVTYMVYPTGTSETVRSLDAFVDLPLDVYIYAISLELLVVGGVAIAGWLTMKRVSEVPYRPRRFLTYLGGVSVLYFIARVGNVVNLEYSPESLLSGIAALIIIALIAVRLFLLPAAILHEKNLQTAFQASWNRSKSHGAALLGLVVLFGLASQWIAGIPLVGVILSSTIVGTIHAVSLAILYERNSDPLW